MPANASAAPNLMANPGFETSGSSATMFSDTLPDFTAWQTASGGFTLSAGLLTSTGAGPSTDLAVVRNSQDYQDGTGKTYPLARRRICCSPPPPRRSRPEPPTRRPAPPFRSTSGFR